MDQRQRDSLSAWWRGEVKWDVDMGACSTLRAGGIADALVDVQGLPELRMLLQGLQEEGIDCRVIGRGSNILVSEQGYAGVIIRLKGAFNDVAQLTDDGSTDGQLLVRVGAGCAMASLLSWCCRHGAAGIEFMTGIPGSVGGAVRMNAGAWGHAIGERLVEVELVDCSGRLIRVPVADLELSYRKLGLPGGDLEEMVIVAALFTLTSGSGEGIRERGRRYLERRRQKQPAGVASAGSFFKNPHGDSAGRLIEAAGLKGSCCGGAMVSPVHANFIVNTGRATAADIVALMEQVQETVFKQSGVRLEPEVQIF